MTAPTWLAPLTSTICAILGISDPGMQPDVKMVLAGAGGLVLTWFVHEQHRTARNADNVAGAVAKARAELAHAPAAVAHIPAELAHALDTLLGRPETVATTAPATPPAPAAPGATPGQASPVAL